MTMASKVRNVWRRVRQSWGSGDVKRAMWNQEFGQGHWDHLGDTPGDCVYRFVEKYACGGDILDLGCGSGNTGNELDDSTYRAYLGVDISDVAIEKASDRSRKTGRTSKNQYVQADIVDYLPEDIYCVILFRESLNYVPRAKMVGMLRRYVGYLAEGGVIIVRLYDRDRYRAIQEIVKRRLSCDRGVPRRGLRGDRACIPMN